MLCSKILVAYDGSDLGKRALRKAIELAKTDSSIEIITIHAVELPPAVTAYAAYSYVDELNKAREYGENVIKEAKETLSAVPNRSRTLVIEGRPEQIILEQSKELNCDMVIMGSRGLSALKELFLGSVSHYVVQHSAVPVLVVKS